MTLASTANTLWRAARDSVARLNRLLAEAEHSDADLVFQIRDPQSGKRNSDRDSTVLARPPGATGESEPHSGLH